MSTTVKGEKKSSRKREKKSSRKGKVSQDGKSSGKGKVSGDVKKNAVLLKVLAKGKKSTWDDILRESDTSLTRAICECTKNVISGRVRCTPNQKRKMRRHVKILRTITEKEVPIHKRRALIKQKGGFLPAILAPLIGIIASVAGALA